MSTENQIVKINFQDKEINNLDSLEFFGSITQDLSLTRQIVCKDGSVINATLRFNASLSNDSKVVFDATVPLTKTVKGEKQGYHKEVLRIEQTENSLQLKKLDDALQLPSKAVFDYPIGNDRKVSIVSYFDAIYYVALPDWRESAKEYVQLNLIPVSWLVLCNLGKVLDFALSTDNDGISKASLNARTMLRNFDEIDYIKALYFSYKQLPNNANLKAVLAMLVEEFREDLENKGLILLPANTEENKQPENTASNTNENKTEQPEQTQPENIIDENKTEQPEQTQPENISEIGEQPKEPPKETVAASNGNGNKGNRQNNKNNSANN